MLGHFDTFKHYLSLRLILLSLGVVLYFCSNGLAGSLKVSWGPVQSTALGGYKIRYGTTSGSYGQSIDVGNLTNFTLQNLAEGSRYYMVVVAYDTSKLEGYPSGEVSGVVLQASAVSASSITQNAGVINWVTNKLSDSQVEYGPTASYGTSTSLNSNLVTSHSISLGNLNPSSTYHFRVRSMDNGGGLTFSGDGTFTTTSAPDSTPPGDVLNFSAVAMDGSVAVNWTNPGNSDYAGVVIRYRTDGVYPTSINDGSLAADIPGAPNAAQSFTHAGLTNNTTYSYSAISYDNSRNYSSTAHTEATPTSVLTLLTLSPTQGRAGSTVIISGSGFGDTQGTSIVTLTGVKATVSGWSKNSISFTVPSQTPSGPVVVTVGAKQSNELQFKVTSKLPAPKGIRLK